MNRLKMEAHWLLCRVLVECLLCFKLLMLHTQYINFVIYTVLCECVLFFVFFSTTLVTWLLNLLNLAVIYYAPLAFAQYQCFLFSSRLLGFTCLLALSFEE